MDTAGMTGVDRASFSPEVHSQEIETQGYTIIPGAISAERVRAAIEALEEIYQRERPIAEHHGEVDRKPEGRPKRCGQAPFLRNVFSVLARPGSVSPASGRRHGAVRYDRAFNPTQRRP